MTKNLQQEVVRDYRHATGDSQIPHITKYATGDIGSWVHASGHIHRLGTQRMQENAAITAPFNVSTFVLNTDFLKITCGTTGF